MFWLFLNTLWNLPYFFLSGTLIIAGDGFTSAIEMAKNVQLFTPVNYNQPGSTRKPVQIDWSLCCLCQENKKDVPLQEPKSTGLDTLAFYIIEFHKINELPHNLNMNHINDGSGISQTLFKNNAKWHKNCKNSYCEEKFKRAKG